MQVQHSLLVSTIVDRTVMSRAFARRRYHNREDTLATVRIWKIDKNPNPLCVFWLQLLPACGTLYRSEFSEEDVCVL